MRSVLFGIVLALVAARLPGDKDVIAVPVLRVPSYSEGVVFDHEGYGYLSHGRYISRFALDGTHSIWAETGQPDGHKILGDGTHLVCDESRHAVLHLDANGKFMGNASAECDGKPLRAPNDLTLDPRGGFYFTDPGDSGKEPTGAVHYVDPQGKTHVIAEGLRYPNGIVLRPDGKTLLVGESYLNRILAYAVMAPGKLGPVRVFADLPAKQGEQVDNQPDGMCLDSEGNLYVAHYGMRQIQVLDRDGRLIRRYPGGNLTISNAAFGGPKMDQLFVTGGIGLEGKSEGGLFRLDLRGVRGLAILPQRR